MWCMTNGFHTDWKHNCVATLNKFLTVAIEGKESPFIEFKRSLISLRDFPSNHRRKLLFLHFSKIGGHDLFHLRIQQNYVFDSTDFESDILRKYTQQQISLAIVELSGGEAKSLLGSNHLLSYITMAIIYNYHNMNDESICKYVCMCM